jgi:hypothetical protein
MPSLFTLLWSKHTARPRSVTRVRSLEQWPTRKPANLLQRVRFTAIRPAREETLYPHLCLTLLGYGAFMALLGASIVSVALPPLPALFKSDLMQMIAAHPVWQATRGELLEPGTHMGQVFTQVTLHASLMTWAVAAAFPALGFVVVLAFLAVHRRISARKESATWSRFYFFSPLGSMTAQAMQRYLAAQPSHLNAQSASARLAWQGMTLFETLPSLKDSLAQGATMPAPGRAGLETY